MLTETISGKCPCCGYDKLFQRYGSMGYVLMDGCANCGFGYASNAHDGESYGVDAWLSYAQHVLACMRAGGSYEEEMARLDGLSNEDLRRAAFEWCEEQERWDDVPTTIFKYTDQDVQMHKALGLPVFKNMEQATT